MKINDFHIGLEFLCGPFWYRCTDVGTRTIAAIRLVESDPVWYQGPPYMITEHVLDEKDLADAFLTEDDAIASAIDNHDTDDHPGFDVDVVERMMSARLDMQTYPKDRRILLFDRVRGDGEILHPYAVRNNVSLPGEDWIVLFYLPFLKQWGEMSQKTFLSLPLSTHVEIHRRAKISTS